ncbi:hypothetical protein [Lysobacter olei]
MHPPTRLLPLFVGVLAVLGASPAGARAPVLAQDALAHARDGGALLYRESHWLYREGATARRLVLYRCPDGRPFARKTVLERTAPHAPDFDFEDARDGYREGVRSTPGGRVVYVRPHARAPLRERRVEMPPGAVIDAGFDASVRQHWDRLRAGRELAQPFLVPSRMGFVPVRVQPGPKVHWRGVQAQRMTMRLDRWYGFAAPSMELTYASEDRRLLEFAGIATIRDASGRHQDVRIVFPQAPAPADAGALQRALTSPLVGRCGG